MSTGHDQFSDLNNSGSSLSSDYSNLENEHPNENDSDENSTWGPTSMQANKQMEKYCFFKIIQGLKLPMLIGEKERRYKVTDLIEISQKQMLI